MYIFQHSQLFATPWTEAHQAPLSVGFSRQECWSGLTFPSPGDLPNPGIEPRSPALQADSLLTELQGKPPNNAVRLQLLKVPYVQIHETEIFISLTFKNSGFQYSKKKKKKSHFIIKCKYLQQVTIQTFKGFLEAFEVLSNNLWIVILLVFFEK